MRFTEPKAQADYEALLATGMNEGDAHEQIERARLAGHYTPPVANPRRFYGSRYGSGDKIRIAQQRAMQDMAVNDPDKYDQYQRIAQAAGVDTTGKTYHSGIAAYPGDPDAWARGNEEVREICKVKGIATGRKDGMLHLQVPIDPREKPQKSMLKKPRIHKPVYKHRRNIERKLQLEGKRK